MASEFSFTLHNWPVALASALDQRASVLFVSDSLTEGEGAVTSWYRTWASAFGSWVRRQWSIDDHAMWLPCTVTDPTDFEFANGVPTGSDIWEMTDTTGVPNSIYTDGHIHFPLPAGTSLFRLFAVVPPGQTGDYTLTPQTGSPVTATGLNPGIHEIDVPNPGAHVDSAGTQGQLGSVVFAGSYDAGLTVYNMSRSGATTTAWLDWVTNGSQLDALATLLAPDLVIIGLGGNDAMQGINPAITETNLTAIAGWAHGLGAEIALSTQPRPASILPGDWDPWQARIRDVAGDLEVPLIEFANAPNATEAPQFYAPDGIHLSDSSSRYFARIAYQTLR